MPESIKLFKKRLYWFIHHCFAHWPLDPTFRFVSNCGEGNSKNFVTVACASTKRFALGLE